MPSVVPEKRLVVEVEDMVVEVVEVVVKVLVVELAGATTEMLMLGPGSVTGVGEAVQHTERLLITEYYI